MSDYLEALLDLQRIEETSGRNAKYDILHDDVNNYYFTSILFLTYNNYIQYYIKKVPKLKGATETPSLSHFHRFLKLLLQLSDREITGNAARDAVIDVLEGCSEVEQKWFTRIIKKDLKIGVALLGINKAMGNFIPEYTVQLANHIDDVSLTDKKAIAMLPDEFIVEPKLDGMRLIAEKVNGVVTLRSRNGKVIEGYDKLTAELTKVMPDNHCLDGELMSVEFVAGIEQAAKDMADEEGYTPNREAFQDLMADAFRKGVSKEGIYNFWDIIPYDEWKNKKSTIPCIQRKAAVDALGDNFECMRRVRHTEVFHKNNPKDIQTLLTLFKTYLRMGYEGAMVKNANATYNFSRNNNLLKMKLFHTADLEVLEVCEGETDGKYAGTMGAVVVDYKGYRVNVGSGFNDADRVHYWKHPEDIVGKTIEVSYQSESQNKTGGLSLSFPTFVCVRQDK